MKYFIDTHDQTKGSFSADDMTEGEFIRLYQKFEKALEEVGGADLGAHVNVKGRKAFCFHEGTRCRRYPTGTRETKLSFRFDHGSQKSNRRGPTTGIRLMLRQRHGATVFSRRRCCGSHAAR